MGVAMMMLLLLAPEYLEMQIRPGRWSHEEIVMMVDDESNARQAPSKLEKTCKDQKITKKQDIENHDNYTKASVVSFSKHVYA